MIAALVKWFPVLAIALVIGGCATQRINWQTRIGNYTYDDAIREFGPSDKHDQLSDGTIIADWVVREGHTVTAPQPYLTGPDGMGPAMSGFSSTYVPTYYMRMTFGPDGKLQSYKNYYQ